MTLSKGLPGNNLFSLICYIVIKIILKAGDFGPKYHEIVSFHLDILFGVSCVSITKILNPSVKLFFVFLFPPSIFCGIISTTLNAKTKLVAAFNVSKQNYYEVG